MIRRHPFSVALAICWVLALALALAPRAVAHARLDRAAPRVGSTVSDAPAQVEIWFTDELDMSSTSIEVLDASGAQVDKKDTHVDPRDKSAAAVSLPQLPPGEYKVVWHARCPQGHNTKGDFTFKVK
jgi:methionine-rich copper-binding protein CopC